VKLCDVCGKRSARYVCQECGRTVCERCIEPYSWLCSECYRKEMGIEPGVEMKISFSFAKMFVLGFILIFVGSLILVFASLLYGLKASLGGFILIGPIPIVFGSGEYSIPLIILGLALAVICIIAFILLNRHYIKIKRL